MSSETSTTWSVAVYRDPDTMAVRFVARSRDGRTSNHFPNAGTERFRQWVVRLENEGLAPIVETVPCRDESDARSVAAALISMHWRASRAHRPESG